MWKVYKLYLEVLDAGREPRLDELDRDTGFTNPPKKQCLIHCYTY